MKIENDNDIVLVDDSDVDARFLGRWIARSRLNNTFLAFESGRSFLGHMESVKAGRAEMPALVLLDINMPGLGGFEVLQMLRTDDAFREFPVVALYTNSDNPRDRSRADELGALFVEKFSSRNEAVDFLNSLAPTMPDYSVFDGLDMGVQVIDQDMRYRYLNRQLLGQIGMPSDEVVGHRMAEKFPGIERTDIYGAIVDCLRTGETGKFTNEFKFADGRVTYWELELHRIDAGVLVFSRDITETKRGALLLKESNKNLEHFAHIAAHDMREPVRRMQLLTEELALDFSDALPAEGVELCEEIGAQCGRLMELITDFRSLAGISGADVGAKETVSAAGLFEGAREAHADRLEAAGIVVSLPTADRQVSAHASMIGILLRNLFENTLKHGHSELNVRFEGEGPGTVFAVSNKTDNPALSRDPFLPFVGRDRANGTGLGLAIAKRVVEYHGGRIWADQEGDTFTIRFTLEGGAPET